MFVVLPTPPTPPHSYGEYMTRPIAYCVRAILSGTALLLQQCSRHVAVFRCRIHQLLTQPTEQRNDAADHASWLQQRSANAPLRERERERERETDEAYRETTAPFNNRWPGSVCLVVRRRTCDPDYDGRRINEYSNECRARDALIGEIAGTFEEIQLVM